MIVLFLSSFVNILFAEGETLAQEVKKEATVTVEKQKEVIDPLKEIFGSIEQRPLALELKINNLAMDEQKDFILQQNSITKSGIEALLLWKICKIAIGASYSIGNERTQSLENDEISGSVNVSTPFKMELRYYFVDDKFKAYGSFGGQYSQIESGKYTYTIYDDSGKTTVQSILDLKTKLENNWSTYVCLGLETEIFDNIWVTLGLNISTRYLNVIGGIREDHKERITMQEKNAWTGIKVLF